MGGGREQPRKGNVIPCKNQNKAKKPFQGKESTKGKRIDKKKRRYYGLKKIIRKEKTNETTAWGKEKYYKRVCI